MFGVLRRTGIKGLSKRDVETDDVFGDETGDEIGDCTFFDMTAFPG